ncbi:MAG: hypothetical protein HY675_05095 [Chloroflexi bacterium]|nr:hypothetical protein [Chloroflexota bacterium]
MIRIVPFATALAAISAVCYLIGVVIALAAPGAFMALMEAWSLLNLAGLVALVTLPGFIVGLVTVTAGAWLFGAAFAAIYNLLTQADTARA